MIHIDSDQGHIGEFWWINSDPSTPIYGGNIKPWKNQWFILWGTCGYGRDNVHVFITPVNETKSFTAN
jgi:hypothetical protein